MAGRKIRDEGDARACLAAMEASELRPSDWSQAHGIDGRSLNAWRLKLRRSAAVQGPVRLVELVAAESTATSGRDERYLVRSGRFTVEVGERFQDDTLLRLLRVVASC